VPDSRPAFALIRGSADPSTRRMKPIIATYECRCGKRCSAAVDHVLAMLSICPACQAARYAAGIKAQKTTPQAAMQNTGDHGK
jgi:hypothetical protein